MEVHHVLGVLARNSLAPTNNPDLDRSSLPSLQVPHDAQEALRLAFICFQKKTTKLEIKTPATLRIGGILCRTCVLITGVTQEWQAIQK